MRKAILGATAILFLTLSCSTGSASTIGQADGENVQLASAGPASGDNIQITPSGKPVMLTKQDFLEKVMNYEKNQTEWVYEGDLPAIIDFYADWCGPCRVAAPILEELAKEYEGRIHIYKVDTEKERELAAVFGISSIPAFLLIPKEGKPAMSNGIAQTQEQTRQMFVQMIEEFLLGKTVDQL